MCGFDEQVNYFSEPIINTLKFKIKVAEFTLQFLK